MRKSIRKFSLIAACSFAIGGCATYEPIVTGSRCTQIKWESDAETVTLNNAYIENTHALLEWPNPIYYGIYIKIPKQYQRSITSIELARWDEWPISDECTKSNNTNRKQCYTTTPELEAGKTAIIFNIHNKHDVKPYFQDIRNYVTNTVTGCAG